MKKNRRKITMKKAFFIFFYMITVFLCGCSNMNPEDSNHLIDQSNVGGVNARGYYFYTFDGYIDFLDEYEPQYKCIENMIKYDSLSSIGQFKAFITFSYLSTQTDGLTSYNYALEDGSETELFLTITDWSRKVYERPKTQMLEDNFKSSDMRIVDETRNGYYLVDGSIRYNYVNNGKLTSIEWDYNGLEFTISLDRIKTYEYPYGYDTFFSRLLDANKASEAVRELMKGIFG